MAPAGIHYTTTSDGVRIAYHRQGSGPPVIIAPGMSLTIEMGIATDEFASSFLGFWARLAEEFTVFRYDMRGFGLSQRNVPVVSSGTMAADLAAVVDAAESEQVSLVGQSHGGQAAIKYTAGHPDRVARLALFGAFASLREKERATARGMAELWLANWGIASDAMARLYRRNENPSPAEMEDFALRQRTTADREAVAQLLLSNAESDLSGCLPRIQSPTLVVHGQDDRVAPFDHGREIAATIPNAELVPYEGEHADWCFGALGYRIGGILSRFLGGSGIARPAPMASLSDREREVLALVAEGLSNQDVAARLSVSTRTVERHVQNIFAKLHVHNRTEATRWALEHGAS